MIGISRHSAIFAAVLVTSAFVLFGAPPRGLKTRLDVHATADVFVRNPARVGERVALAPIFTLSQKSDYEIVVQFSPHRRYERVDGFRRVIVYSRIENASDCSRQECWQELLFFSSRYGEQQLSRRLSDFQGDIMVLSWHLDDSKTMGCTLSTMLGLEPIDITNGLKFESPSGTATVKVRQLTK